MVACSPHLMDADLENIVEKDATSHLEKKCKMPLIEFKNIALQFTMSELLGLLLKELIRVLPSHPGFSVIGEYTGADHDHNIMVPFRGEPPGSEGPDHNRLPVVLFCGEIVFDHLKFWQHPNISPVWGKCELGFPTMLQDLADLRDRVEEAHGMEKVTFTASELPSSLPIENVATSERGLRVKEEQRSRVLQLFVLLTTGWRRVKIESSSFSDNDEEEEDRFVMPNKDYLAVEFSFKIEYNGISFAMKRSCRFLRMLHGLAFVLFVLHADCTF
ncbi:hypothetical protein M5K25_000739 [Dendrobium thyrsiflorum]|uniref:Uncharacterized protein n=1 Tax=Dendrobium thyrsiflorum TaxID=117978 RepID=A0ABD0VUC7_DENTH